MEIGQVLGVQDSSFAQPANLNLGRDEFLKLLITQLQMQDPFEPMNNEEMVAQLATFSSLEQLENINSGLTQGLEMDALIGQLLNNTMATTLIGKDVTVSTNRFTIGDSGEASLGYRLYGDAQSVKVNVYNADGVKVRTIDDLETSNGVHEFTWDGKNNDGKSVPTGNYRFEIEAKGSSDTVIGSDPLMIGRVDGIRYANGQAMLLIGDTEMSLGLVLEVFERALNGSLPSPPDSPDDDRNPPDATP